MIVRRAGTDSSVQLDLANAWFPFTQPAWLLLLRAASALLAVTLLLSVARPEPLWGPAWKKNREVRRGRLLRLVAMLLLNVYVCEERVRLWRDGCVDADRALRCVDSQRVWAAVGAAGCRRVCSQYLWTFWGYSILFISS